MRVPFPVWCLLDGLSVCLRQLKNCASFEQLDTTQFILQKSLSWFFKKKFRIQKFSSSEILGSASLFVFLFSRTGIRNMRGDRSLCARVQYVGCFFCNTKHFCNSYIVSCIFCLTWIQWFRTCLQFVSFFFKLQVQSRHSLKYVGSSVKV